MVLGMTGCGNDKAKSYSKYVELGEYKGVKYTKTVEDVTTAEIDAKVNAFLNGLAEEKEIKDRAVEDGDIVNIDYVGKKDGEAFEGGTADAQDLTIGSGQFIDGFETGLIGHNIGETVDLDLKFPDDYQSEELKGQEVVFTVTINSIKVKKTPELTDALVKENTDYDTIKAYKDSIRKELEESKKTAAEEKAEQDIFNAAVKACKITGYDEKEVEALIDQQFDSFKKQAESYAAYGYTYEDVMKQAGFENEKELKEGITEFVKNFLNQKMVLYCIADKEGIKATSEETDKLVKEYMETYSIKTKEEVYEFYGDDYFELAVLTDKVVAVLKENAVLVDSLEETTEEEKKDSKKTSEKKEDKKAK